MAERLGRGNAFRRYARLSRKFKTALFLIAASWNIDHALQAGGGRSPIRAPRSRPVSGANEKLGRGTNKGRTAMKATRRGPIASAAIRLGTAALVAAAPAMSRAQEMLKGVDLSQPAYSASDFSREEIVTALKSRKDNAAPLDFSGKSLNGADLSGLDLSNVNFRAARMVRTRLSGARLDHAILDQAWLLEADLTGASLIGAHVFAAQLQRAKADGADFSRARITADLTGASLRGAKFIEANLSADMKNQSMGLMRAVLSSAVAEGANFTAADLMNADLRFLHAAGADFSGAGLQGANAAGADFTGARWDGVKADGLDLDSAQVDAAAAQDALKDAANLDRARIK
jgi:uncharacterized protein YjbI with pentapeptide repeats